MSLALSSPGSIELETVFHSFDKDGDGKISASELAQCMTIILDEQFAVEEARNLLETVDIDGDGLLDIQEFLKLVEEEEEEARSSVLKAAFEMYESEGEGFITAKSLKRMLSKLGNSRAVEDCQAMICRFDLNGDGVMSFDEFRVMMNP